MDNRTRLTRVDAAGGDPVAIMLLTTRTIGLRVLDQEVSGTSPQPGYLWWGKNRTYDLSIISAI